MYHNYVRQEISVSVETHKLIIKFGCLTVEQRIFTFDHTNCHVKLLLHWVS